MKFTNYDDRGFKIGILVQRTLRDYLEWEKITYSEIQRLKSKEYCKSIFRCNYPILVEDITDNNIKKRYYKDSVESYGYTYYMCNDWYESNRVYYLKWICKWKNRYELWSKADRFICETGLFDEWVYPYDVNEGEFEDVSEDMKYYLL